MASEINRAYHAALRKADYRRVGHALKSNAEQAMRNRNPDFLGTDINPVNSGPRVFFWTKDEARVPWSSLINVDFQNKKFMGAGVEPAVTGALATRRGYAKQQLERKAMDLEMIRSMAPMPVESLAQASAEMDDVQRRTLEVGILLRQVSDAVGDGSADSFTVENLRRVIPSIVDLVPYLTAVALEELRGSTDDAIEIGRSVPDAYAGAPTNAKARDAITVLMRKLNTFIASAIDSSGQDRDSRRVLARQSANKIFRGANEELFADEDVPAQADDAELEAQQLEDDETRPVLRVAPARRGAPAAAAAAAAAAPEPAAAGESAEIAKVRRYLRSSVKGRTEMVRKAFSDVWDRWSSDRELKKLLPRGAKRLDERNVTSMGPAIIRYMERTGDFPNEEFRAAIQRYRG